jgi:hypothetical protein
MLTPMRKGARHFEKGPFQTNNIISSTALLAGVLVLVGGLLAHYWARMPALAAFFVLAMAFLLISFWRLVLKTHSELHRLLTSGAANFPEPGSREDLAFGVAAGLSFQALLITATLVGAGAMAIVELLHGRP